VLPGRHSRHRLTAATAAGCCKRASGAATAAAATLRSPLPPGPKSARPYRLPLPPGRRRLQVAAAIMGTEPGNATTDAAALKAKLDTLVKDVEEAEEKAVAARRRARATRTLLEEEQTTATLEKAAIAARQLVPGSSSSTTHTTPAASSYEETVVAGLHLQATAVLNVRSLVNIVLDFSSTTYASWRDLMMIVLERYALLDHVDSDVAASTDLGWRRMDSVVLNWINNSITPELRQVVRERGATARHLWLAIEN
jgi:hypothetical protein